MIETNLFLETRSEGEHTQINWTSVGSLPLLYIYTPLSPVLLCLSSLSLSLLFLSLMSTTPPCRVPPEAPSLHMERDAVSTLWAWPDEGIAVELSALAEAVAATSAAGCPVFARLYFLKAMDARTLQEQRWDDDPIDYLSPGITPRPEAEQSEEVHMLAQAGAARAAADGMLTQWPFLAGTAVYEAIATQVAAALATAAQQALGMSWGVVLATIRLRYFVMGRPEDGGLTLDMLRSEESSNGEGGGLFASVPAEESAIEMLECVTGGAGDGGAGRQGPCTICWEEFRVAAAARMPCGHVYHRECIARWLRSSHMCPLCRYEMPKKKDHQATQP